MDTKTATEISQGFSAGNYANAYESEDLETAMAGRDLEDRSEAYRAAFVVGFFASYEVHEIPGSDLEAFEQAFWGEYGKACVAAGYCEDRPAEDWRAAGYDV